MKGLPYVLARKQPHLFLFLCNIVFTCSHNPQPRSSGSWERVYPQVVGYAELLESRQANLLSICCMTGMDCHPCTAPRAYHSECRWVGGRLAIFTPMVDGVVISVHFLFVLQETTMAGLTYLTSTLGCQTVMPGPSLMLAVSMINMI